MGIVKSTEAANATIWRALVKQFYEACGSPMVTGYSDSQVHYILAGQRPIEPKFMNALISACKARIQLAEAGPAATAAGLPSRSATATATATTAPTRQIDRSPRSPDASGATVLMFNRGFALDRDARLATATVPGPRTRRHEPRTGPPPNPQTATTAAQFIELMRQLRAWSGMSLRDIEESSRLLNDGRDWIPRSSLADVLKRDTLPRAELLATFTAALGLPIADRARWSAMHRILADATASPDPRSPALTLCTKSEPETSAPRGRLRWPRRKRKP
jgi:hypothetical protein